MFLTRTNPTRASQGLIKNRLMGTKPRGKAISCGPGSGFSRYLRYRKQLLPTIVRDLEWPTPLIRARRLVGVANEIVDSVLTSPYRTVAVGGAVGGVVQSCATIASQINGHRQCTKLFLETFLIRPGASSKRSVRAPSGELNHTGFSRGFWTLILFH